jgi:hypothetical protein
MNAAQTASAAAAVLIGGVAFFQFALALGAPYGDAVFGGKAPTESGALTGPFRALAVVQAIVLALLGWILLARTELVDVPLLGAGSLTWITWVIVAFLVLNTAANFGGPTGDDEQLTDLPVGAALGNEAEHLDLTVGQSCRRSTSGGGGIVSCCGEHRTDGVRVESSRAGIVEQLLLGLVRREGRPVRPAFGHRVVGVGRRQHTCRRGQLTSRAAPVVPAAVETFVMPADEGHQ